MKRLTSQRALILNYLKKTKTHPSAEEVYQQVKKQLPQISLATVYRNLGLLKNKGQLQEVIAESIHYDADTKPHAHFICQKCHRIYDLYDRCYLLKHKKTKVGQINQSQIYLYGQCHKCQRQ